MMIYNKYLRLFCPLVVTVWVARLNKTIFILKVFNEAHTSRRIPQVFIRPFLCTYYFYIPTVVVVSVLNVLQTLSGHYIPLFYLTWLLDVIFYCEFFTTTGFLTKYQRDFLVISLLCYVVCESRFCDQYVNVWLSVSYQPLKH